MGRIGSVYMPAPPTKGDSDGTVLGEAPTPRPHIHRMADRRVRQCTDAELSRHSRTTNGVLMTAEIIEQALRVRQQAWDVAVTNAPMRLEDGYDAIVALCATVDVLVAAHTDEGGQ